MAGLGAWQVFLQVWQPSLTAQTMVQYLWVQEELGHGWQNDRVGECTRGFSREQRGSSLRIAVQNKKQQSQKGEWV